MEKKKKVDIGLTNEGLNNKQDAVRKKLSDDMNLDDYSSRKLLSSLWRRTGNHEGQHIKDYIYGKNRQLDSLASGTNYTGITDLLRGEDHLNEVVNQPVNTDDLDPEVVDTLLKEAGFKIQEAERPSLFETLKQRLRK